MAAGGGLTYWGHVVFVAAVAATVVAPPIAAMAAGVGLFGIGLFMAIERLQRAAPHEYVVRAHVHLGDVEDYLRQWIRNPPPLGMTTKTKWQYYHGTNHVYSP